MNLSTNEKTTRQQAEEKYWKNFYSCLFRMAKLHSWYKCKGICRTGTCVPVLGNEQEPRDSSGFFDKKMESKFLPDEILWHFDVNNNDWHEEPDPRLQKVIADNSVVIKDFSHFFFECSESSRLESVFRDNAWYVKNSYSRDTVNRFVKSWTRFSPICEAFEKSASNIIDFILANPDVPLPKACSNGDILVHDYDQ